VQWYQAEICHVTTHADFEGHGHGKAMVKRAEERARKDGARLLQCTIRVGNKASEGLFTTSGFTGGPMFNNPDSGNNVRVWSKPLYAPQDNGDA
jgi:ribosomal protein S18 acetylase RimI-like enzyme